MENNFLGAALWGQTGWFLGSLVVGAAAMLLYTIIRAFTRTINRWPFVVAAGDVLFFVLLGVLEFMFLYILPQNALRWFHLLGQILGGILFWVTLAPLCFGIFVFCDQKLIAWLKR
jgi:hypothetical protein